MTQRQSRKWFPHLDWFDERNLVEGLDGDSRLARKPLRLGTWLLCEADHCMNASQNEDVHCNSISKFEGLRTRALRMGIRGRT